jgi:DNA-binding transcriptional LysR family regulator
MEHLMDFVALADFNLVARHGGFGKAARASGRPKATLSRRVTELEAALNMRLFERGARNLKLTQEGHALHTRTSALMTELEETTIAIASGAEKPHGRLRISAPLVLAQTAMGKISGDFALRYPDVRLEITTEDRAVDMIEEGYDLVIRVNPHPDEALVGRAFLHDRMVVVARPDFARPEKGLPAPGIVRGPSDRQTWNVTTQNGPVGITIEPVLALSSLIMVRDAVRTGVGVARLPISLVSDDLSDGTLLHWGDIEGSQIALWALYPSRRLLSTRVQAFLDFLKQSFPNGTPDELAAYMRR